MSSCRDMKHSTIGYVDDGLHYPRYRARGRCSERLWLQMPRKSRGQVAENLPGRGGTRSPVAEHHGEIAPRPNHSIASSAGASSAEGTVRPIAWTVRHWLADPLPGANDPQGEFPQVPAPKLR